MCKYSPSLPLSLTHTHTHTHTHRTAKRVTSQVKFCISKTDLTFGSIQSTKVLGSFKIT